MPSSEARQAGIRSHGRARAYVRSAMPGLNVLLVGFAASAFELARLQSLEQRWWMAADTTIALMSTLFAARFLRGPVREVVFLLAISLFPLAVEPLLRFCFHFGSPPEFLMLAAVRNLMFALVVGRGLLTIDGARAQNPRSSWSPLATATSLFVTLTSVLLVAHWSVYVLAASYGLVGLWWLMGQSWERLRGRLTTSTTHDPPLVLRLSPLILVGAIAGVSALTVAGSNTSSATAGIFYSSGGDRWPDPFAAQGVSDGDMLVAATGETESFGPVESEIFMTSEAPSLYDVINDTYGKACPKRFQEKAVALDSKNVIFSKEEKSQTKQSGREFSTVRKPNRSAAKPPDRPSDALLVVQGRVPLHLRLDTFDTFDGREWTRGPASRIGGQLRLASPPGAPNDAQFAPWVVLDRSHRSPLLGPPQYHRLKVINLNTTRVPTPEHLAGVRIDQINRVDLFSWTHDDVLDMPDRERVPPLTVIQLGSHCLRNPSSTIQPLGFADSACLVALPATPRAADLRRLAEEWTAGVAPGWPQVEAICKRLRSDYVLDSDYRPPEDCPDVVAEFLFESHRGPDYLFASAATLLLRSCGIPARTAMGLYADPARYERLGHQTPVFQQDLHTWTEMLVDHHTWKTVDASPGYEVLQPPQSIWETALTQLFGIGRWCWNCPWVVVALVMLLGSAILCRRSLLDRVAWWAWCFGWRLCPNRRIEFTVRLLELRASLAGRRRPRGATLLRWYSTVAENETDSAVTLRQFLALATRKLYQPTHVSRAVEDISACGIVARDWTWRKFLPGAVSYEPRVARPLAPLRHLFSWISP